MKAILRSASLAAVYLTVLGCLTTTSWAQDPCEDADGIAALDTKVRENYIKDETVSIAVQSAKVYLQKYATCESAKALADWIIPRLPSWEERAWRWPRSVRFDEGVKTKKFGEVYAAGAELVERYPDNVQYLLPLGLIGLYESYRNNFKYNDDSIKYAKFTLAKLKSGSAEPKKKDGKPVLDANGKEVFGVYQFERNAENAISELNYALGYILYHAKNDRKAGLLYFYETSLTPGAYKNEPRLYATIGQYYRDEAMPIGKAIAELIRKQDLAASLDEKAKLDVEIRAKIALRNGYLERSLDSFSRAYKFSDEKVASEKTLKEQMFKLLQATHALREGATNLDKWIADAGKSPFPDPTSEVKPVFDPEPAKDLSPDAPKPPAVKPPSVKGKTNPNKPT